MFIWKICCRESESGSRHRKEGAACAVCILVCMTVTGCVSGPKNMQKIRDLEFTVLDREAIPEELELLIEENKDEPFKLTYADQGYLYIAEGYGARLTTGYSVKVNELYEAEDAVCIHTSLLGPEKGEETKRSPHFPMWQCSLSILKKMLYFSEEDRDGVSEKTDTLCQGRTEDI